MTFENIQPVVSYAYRQQQQIGSWNYHQNVKTIVWKKSFSTEISNWIFPYFTISSSGMPLEIIDKENSYSVQNKIRIRRLLSL